MKEAIEKKVTKAILQQPEEFKVGGKTYNAAPPSIATLILASEAISRLPQKPLDQEHATRDALAYAKDVKPLGELAAILILGAKSIDDKVPVVVEEERKYLWGLIKRRTKRRALASQKELLAKDILESCSPQELNTLLYNLLKRMQVADFFALTTFLTEANMIRQTKVEDEN